MKSMLTPALVALAIVTSTAAGARPAAEEKTQGATSTREATQTDERMVRENAQPAAIGELQRRIDSLERELGRMRLREEERARLLLVPDSHPEWP